VWHSGNGVSMKFSTVSPVSTGMGDHLRAGTSPWYCM